MIYLDTHCVAWLYAGLIERFTVVGRECLEREDIYISPIVALELQYLYEIQRIRVPSSEMIEYLKVVIDLQICPLEFYHVMTESLSLNWTRDPFDRIIVAQSIAGGGPLLTKDEVIRKNYDAVIW